jgi:hypothetical protein
MRWVSQGLNLSYGRPYFVHLAILLGPDGDNLNVIKEFCEIS